MSAAPQRARRDDLLRERFGLETLHPMQARIIDHVLAGRDALVVLPTGSGKSLCFQLPALALPGPGVTLVFSPLIALMQDQVVALKQRGIAAEFINSTLRREEREARQEALARGDYELVYATPERMRKSEFRAALEAVPGGVKLLAVDEAHCITRWGHDFRPAYQEVGEFRRLLGSPPTIALTATATPAVREDIRRTLGLSPREMPLFAAGIDRPNLLFEAEEVWSNETKLDRVVEVAAAARGTVIVYFALIKTLEEMAFDLRRRGVPFPIEIYHGRLDPAEKRRVYERFARSTPDEGLVLLATNAFGMGVDKPDIRAIVHAQVPGSVEAYYQEVGRAGRDGLPSRCLLLYESADLAIQQQFLEWSNPSAEVLVDTAHAFRTAPNGTLDVDTLRERVTGRDRGDRRVEYAVIALEKLGVIEPAETEEEYRFVRVLDPGELSPDAMEEKLQRDLRRLLDVLELFRSEDIRRFVLDYFDLDENTD